MDITIHLETEQAQKLEYIRQQTNQEATSVLSSYLTVAIDTYYQEIHPRDLEHLANDHSVNLRQSKFIGCFEGPPELSTNSKANFKTIMNEKNDHC